jgi:hypothetical protein
VLLQQLLGHGYCSSSENALVLNEKERARDAHYGDDKATDRDRVFEVVSFRAGVGDDARERLFSLGLGLMVLSPRPRGLLVVIDDKHVTLLL